MRILTLPVVAGVALLAACTAPAPTPDADLRATIDALVQTVEAPEPTATPIPTIEPPPETHAFSDLQAAREEVASSLFLVDTDFGCCYFGFLAGDGLIVTTSFAITDSDAVVPVRQLGGNSFNALVLSVSRSSLLAVLSFNPDVVTLTGDPKPLELSSISQRIGSPIMGLDWRLTRTTEVAEATFGFVTGDFANDRGRAKLLLDMFLYPGAPLIAIENGNPVVAGIYDDDRQAIAAGTITNLLSELSLNLD